MRDRGQATIELIGTVPLVLAAVLGAAQALAIGAAREAAGAAAHAGALAIAQGREAAPAARSAAGDVPPGRLVVRVEGRTVTVKVAARQVLPGLGEMLKSEATASAGPR
ncbi:MAG: hypothetical protein V9E83_01820 [Baekduia sp.]